MENLLTYILQVNLLLTFLFLGYICLLKGMTFYVLNRIYFVVGSIYAFIYPFMDIKSWFINNEVIYVEYIPELWSQLLAMQEQKTSVEVLTLTDIIIGMVGVVGLFFILKLITQLVSLFRIHLYSKSSNWQSYVFRNVLFPVVPFSFFNKIYVHKEQHQEKELQDIFAHETIHVKGHHTLDILLFEIILVICWYNPFIWFMRKTVRQNLEFLTDQQVLNKGVDKQTYQYSLLHVTKQGAAVGISNQFNFKTLKKRIMMMNKKRSSKLELSKYAFLLPVFLIAGASFTVSKAEKNIEKIVEKSQNTTVIDESLQVKMKKEVSEVLKNTIGAEISSSDSSKQIYNADYPLVPSTFNKEELRGKNLYFKIDEKLVSLDEFYNFPRSDIYGVDIYTDKEEIRKKIGKENSEGYFVITSRDWIAKNYPVEQLQKMVNEGNERGLTFTVEENGKKRVIKGQYADFEALKKLAPFYDYESSKRNKKLVLSNNGGQDSLKNKNGKLIIIDSKYGSEKEIKKLSSNDIKSILIMQDTIVAKQGEIYIITNNTSTGAEKGSLTLDQIINGEELASKRRVAVRGRINSNLKNKTLIIVDEKEPQTKMELKGVINGLSIDDASLTTKEQRVNFNSFQTIKPLIIVDEKEMNKDYDLNSLNVNNIQSISVLKDQSATALYGDKGKNGVLIIQTKGNDQKEVVVTGFKKDKSKTDSSKTVSNDKVKEVIVTGHKKK